MTDWIVAGVFMGCVAGLAGCFVLVVTAGALWAWDQWTARRTNALMPTGPVRCAACRHYAYPVSECRRHAPPHPHRFTDDWCGDFERYVPKEDTK